MGFRDLKVGDPVFRLLDPIKVEMLVVAVDEVITHSHFLGRRFCVITPNFRARFLRLQTRVSRIVWKGFAPLSLAVSTVVRTSASAWAAHMAR